MDRPRWKLHPPDASGDYLVWRMVAKRREVLSWDSKKQKWLINNYSIKDVQLWCEIPDVP